MEIGFSTPSHPWRQVMSWRNSKAEELQTVMKSLLWRRSSRRTSVRIRCGSPFSSTVVVCGHCLVTLSLTINETLKWLSSLPILMQESFWWWQCSNRYIISLSPFSPSLISLMVSVDVKHHVCLLTSETNQHTRELTVALERRHTNAITKTRVAYGSSHLACE